MKVKIKQLEPGFSPLPSIKQMEMLEATQKVLGWEFPIDEVKREQATDLINRAMKAAKRQGKHLLLEANNNENPAIKKVNEELQSLSN